MDALKETLSQTKPPGKRRPSTEGLRFVRVAALGWL